MDRNKAIETLKELNSTIKHWGTSSITQYNGHFNDALTLAIESLENCDKELPTEFKERLEKEKEVEIKKERENAIKDMQSKCNHEWGPVEWTWCCGGYRTCKICGLTEDYYERD